MNTKTTTAALRSIGAVLAIGGVLTLVNVGRSALQISAVWHQAMAAGQGGVLWGVTVLLVVFALLGSLSTVGGVQLLLRRPTGYWLGLVGLLPQTLSIVVPGFQYRFAMIGFVGAGAYSTKPLVRVGLHVEWGTQLSVAFEPATEWAAFCNLGALVAVVFLVILRRRSSTSSLGDGATGEQAVEAVGPAAGRP
jgi:hypothetical protein